MSPIRKERAALYGDDWAAFSKRIRFRRARGRCECRGECGRRHDGYRHARCGVRHGMLLNPATGSRVVLTVAHLCHDEACRDEEHVRAMCQGCHLRYDAHHHARNASATRDGKRGQLRLEIVSEGAVGVSTPGTATVNVPSAIHKQAGDRMSRALHEQEPE